jgi:hypothetical protein
MLGHEDEALQTDAYIEALLASHAGRPALLPDPESGPSADLRQTIVLLEAGLPRFHPSFLFEEALAARLRAAALGEQLPNADDLLLAELIELPAARSGVNAALVDRRLLLGGAIASGVSLAGAAVVAWRMRERGRPRRRWLA